jgi:hypothetical protein
MVDDLSEGHVYYGLTRYWLYCKRACFPCLLLRMDRWLDLNNYSTVVICICPKEFDCQTKKGLLRVISLLTCTCGYNILIKHCSLEHYKRSTKQSNVCRLPFLTSESNNLPHHIDKSTLTDTFNSNHSRSSKEQ